MNLWNSWNWTLSFSRWNWNFSPLHLKRYLTSEQVETILTLLLFCCFYVQAVCFCHPLANNDTTSQAILPPLFHDESVMMVTCHLTYYSSVRILPFSIESWEMHCYISLSLRAIHKGLAYWPRNWLKRWLKIFELLFTVTVITLFLLTPD